MEATEQISWFLINMEWSPALACLDGKGAPFSYQFFCKICRINDGSSTPDQLTYKVLDYWVNAFSPHNTFIFWPECDMDRIRLNANGNFFFFLPMNNAIISEYFCVKVLVAAVRLLVSNHI